MGCTRIFNHETYREYHIGELLDAESEDGLSWEHEDLFLVKTFRRRIPIGIAAWGLVTISVGHHER